MDGLTLADVLRARAPLGDGEAATVAVPLATELDEWHVRGTAYGPLTLDDVVVEPDGRPHLAPRHGQPGGTEHDLAHLLRMVTAAMAQPAGADDEPGLRTVLADLLAAGCSSGREVVDACFAVVDPEPLRLPDAGALARAQLLAGDAASRLAALSRPRATRPDPRADSGVPPRRLESASARSRADRRDGCAVASGRAAVRRQARRRARVVRLALVVVALVAVAVTGVLLRRPASGPAVDPAAAVAIDPVLDRDAPAAAAAALTRRRAAALVAGTGLDTVDHGDGPARASDEAVLAGLGTDRLEGLGVDVQAAEEVAGTGDGGDAWAAVTSAMSPYRRVGRSGTVDVPGTTPRTVVLHLRWTDDGWRVWSVEQPS